MHRFSVLQTLSTREKWLWISSTIVLIISFLISQAPLPYLIVSLIGVTALLFLAKGEPLGQILTIVFSIGYAIIAFEYRYYGEMFTYVGMTLPSALIAFIIWVKHPHQKDSSVVKIALITPTKVVFLLVSSMLVSYLFYELLAHLQTPNLGLSTLSVLTSYSASMLMFFRSQHYAIFYALNDLVLILLWVLASIEDITFLPMVLCFVVFLVHDVYAYVNWYSLLKKQRSSGQ